MNNWHERAACRGATDLMFPGRGDCAGFARAKALCASCPVAEPCLAFAMEFEETEGVWGGTSGNERRALRKTQWEQLLTAQKRGHGLIETWRDGCRCEMCEWNADRQARRRETTVR